MLETLRYAERAVLQLRALYESRGYARYKMSRFEEYDLYAQNRDFLASDSIITFTDGDGRLMAMKPDVTLSIVKSCAGMRGGLRRLHYSENVYRSSRRSPGFREIMQLGLECIGEVGASEKAEVLRLAAESLYMLSPDSVIELSHLGVVSALLDGAPAGQRSAVVTALGEKNVPRLRDILSDGALSPENTEAICRLAALHGSPAEVMEELDALPCACLDAVRELKALVAAFSGSGFEKMLRIDFSAVGDMSYYNGVVFRGYVRGLPSYILSGGEYDTLMRRMRSSAGAIGFAINADMLEEIDGEDGEAKPSGCLGIALPKGRLGEQVYSLFERAGWGCPGVLEPGRRLVFENPELGLRYFWVKPTDVPIYVERGAADIGVAGRDVLLEQQPDVYSLLDLHLGVCRMAVAAKRGFQDRQERTLRVATKYANMARSYYLAQGRDIDIIELHGSIELAPILGLSDVIVDIVETGKTLRENDLEVIDTVADISARLIASRAGYKFRSAEIERLTKALAALTEE